MVKKLVLFTADFPYGTGETFLETEINYLSIGFDEVKIFSQNTSSNECRSLPNNCSATRINLDISFEDKIKAIVGLFNPLFWKELQIIKSVYRKRLTKEIISTILISLYRAKKLKSEVIRLNQHNDKIINQYFYSYWCDDSALALAMLQKEYEEIFCFSRFHGWDVYFEASKINYLPFRHFISENLKVVFSISQNGIEYAIKTWKPSRNEVFQLSRLGVGEQKNYAINNKDFIVVSCSNVIPLKRVDLIVYALAQIKDLSITWVHFGDGLEFDNVKFLANKVLPSNISFVLKGRLSNQEVLSWYEKNYPNVFINLSTTEGIPVSIMEAMSFGIPIIATDVGGTGEIVNDDNGILLRNNPTLEEVKLAIKEVIENPQKRIAAYQTWKEKYNAEKNYKDFIKLIQSF